jgi:hypothetical protein
MEQSDQGVSGVSMFDGQFAIADLPRLLGLSAAVISNAIAHGALKLSGGVSETPFVMRSDLVSWLKRRPYAALFSDETGEIRPD